MSVTALTLESLVAAEFRRTILVVLAIVLGMACAAGATETIKIMPLGDSLTNGTGTESGYRLRLWNEMTAAGYSIDYVGTLDTNGCAALPDWDHEGHPGFNVDNIANGWSTVPGIDTYLAPGVYDPDIILLMVGTNDTWENNDFAHVGDRLDDLITRISGPDGLQPDAHLIVATIPPQKTYDYNTDWYNQQLVPIVNGHVADGWNVTLVDMYNALDSSDFGGDGVHPLQSGYNKMADVWFEGIQAVLTPEPASLTLLAIGGLAVLRRRRK
jgi:lysophospholipase L1-like esterase